jgi:hypothetical protein
MVSITCVERNRSGVAEVSRAGHSHFFQRKNKYGPIAARAIIVSAN